MTDTSFWFALLAAVSWGIAPIFEKWGVVHTSPYFTLMVQSFVVSFSLLAIGVNTGQLQGMAELNKLSWLYLGIAGLLSGLLAQLFYYKALQGGEIGRIIPLISSLQIVIDSTSAAVGLARSDQWDESDGHDFNYNWDILHSVVLQFLWYHNCS